MKTEKIRVYFTTGYGGRSIKAGVIIGEEHSGKSYNEIEKLKKKKGYKPPVDYVLEIDWLENYILKQLEEKGYTTSISKRQKYPRITINP